MMPRGSRVLTPETAGGALLDIGVYPITYCYRLFGYPGRIVCGGTLKNGIDIAEKIILGYDGFDCTITLSFKKLTESFRIAGSNGRISIPAFHMARLAVIKTKNKTEFIRGRTDYLTEFTRAADEIRAGKTESAYVPHAATRDCMAITDECRRQLGLVYPFENRE